MVSGLPCTLRKARRIIAYLLPCHCFESQVTLEVADRNPESQHAAACLYSDNTGEHGARQLVRCVLLTCSGI